MLFSVRRYYKSIDLQLICINMVNKLAIKLCHHGDVVARDTIRKHISEKFDWDAEVPELFEEVDI